ncbi:solute carrier family 22 member 7-like [Haemaphysalis longicornis]
MSLSQTTPTVAKKSKRTHFTTDPYTGEEPRDSECTPFGNGPFQLLVLLITTVAGGVLFIQYTLFGLSSREMDHWCRRPKEFAHMSVGAWKQFAIPRSANGSYSRCTVRDPPDGGLSARVVACTAWEFNLSEYGNTVVSEWSLVCHRAYLSDVASFVNSAAMILSLPVAGAAADHIGRKTVSFVALTALLLTLVTSSLAVDLQTFIVTRAIAAATSTSLVSLFVVLYEVTTPDRRLAYCTVALALATVFGEVYLFFVEYFKVGWSMSQLLIAALGPALLATYFTLEESPAWLLAKQNIDEADRVVREVARFNGKPSKECSTLLRTHLKKSRLPGEEGDLASVFPTPRWRRFLLIAFVWLVVGWTYSHYTTGFGKLVSRPVSVGTTLLLVPMFMLVWPLLKGGRRVTPAVRTSLLVFSASSALLFALTDREAPLVHTVLHVTMRLSIHLPTAFLFYITISLYPTRMRSKRTDVRTLSGGLANSDWDLIIVEEELYARLLLVDGIAGRG